MGDRTLKSMHKIHRPEVQENSLIIDYESAKSLRYLDQFKATIKRPLGRQLFVPRTPNLFWAFTSTGYLYLLRTLSPKTALTLGLQVAHHSLNIITIPIRRYHIDTLYLPSSHSSRSYPAQTSIDQLPCPLKMPLCGGGKTVSRKLVLLYKTPPLCSYELY